MRVLFLTSTLSLGGLRPAVEKLASCIFCLVALVSLSTVATAEEWERYMANKKWPEAIVALKSELTRRPEDLLLQEKLAIALVYSRRREEALRWLSHALERESNASRKAALKQRLRIMSRTFVEDSTFQIFQEGTNALQRGDLNKAQAAFVRALTREPDHIEILVRLAQVHLLRGDADSAVEKLRSAQSLNPFEPEIHLALGEALIRRGEMTEGLKWVHKANGLIPTCISCARITAEALEKQGNMESALVVLDGALKSQSGQARADLFLTWARVAMIRDPSPAQGTRIRRELEDLFQLSSSDWVPSAANELTQYRAGQDLSLTRILGGVEQKAQRAEARRLLERLDSFEKAEGDG